MKSKFIFVTYVIVFLCGVFLIGCNEKETIQHKTEQNTELGGKFEIETTTSIEDFYQVYIEAIADIDIEELKVVANDYYNDLTFIDEIIDIRICKNASEIKAFIGEEYVLGEVVVLEIDAITDGINDKRFMVLNKHITGVWKVYSEGR